MKAPLTSPVLTGTPTAPTAAAGDASLKLANTSFVQAAIAAVPGRLIGVQVFSVPGTSTYTPTPGTASVIVESVGGGGGSGGVPATGAGQNALAGCGGNGAYAKSSSRPVLPA
ncbi:hypothetical protein [Chitiniphilus shinanonensis]|uniref:hypothetical protein n=1 Tax=Chitiniphilus shinanonensis TaxID=553088 RepID=UPI00304F3808